MTLRVRALLAALIVVTVAAAGALFVGYRTGVLAGQHGIDVATTGDVSDLFASNGADGTRMVDLALRKLESSFYKPVDPQTPVDGEATALRGYLKSKKIPHASLPQSANDNASSVADLLSYAQSHYATQLGTT